MLEISLSVSQKIGLTDTWILSQILRTPKIRFTGHRTLKIRKSKVWVLRFFWEGEVSTGANMDSKCGAETEGKVIQRLPHHLRIHPKYSHQITESTHYCRFWQAHTDRSLMWLSPERPCQMLTIQGKMQQPIIGLITGSPMEEMEKALKLLKGFAAP